METVDDKILLPHHKQQSLCTTRLPYRQGRKLTAVKVYTVTNESNHLLIFGVPSLNLRQELKSQFIKFGKLLQFNISTKHVSEQFTETYHAQYEKIQSAKLAKRMLDTKNFYGGVLHVCYAPEFETIAELKDKLVQRQKDVLFRLRNLQKDTIVTTATEEVKVQTKADPIKLNMGEVNTVLIGDNVRKRKKKSKKTSFDSIFKDNKVIDKGRLNDNKIIAESGIMYGPIDINKKELEIEENRNNIRKDDVKTTKKRKRNIEDETIELEKDIPIIDCTQVECEVITNINEHLNYNKFGNEDIRKVPPKPVNKICFNVNKKL